MQQITEKIWYGEYQIRRHNGKTGKQVRKACPWLSDGQGQDLAEYIYGDYTVTITPDPNDWVDGYEAIRSCMQGKGALCQRAYTPHGVQIALLRDRNGAIVARALVRVGPDGAMCNRAYGSKHHLLMVALTALGGVVSSPRWLDGVGDVVATESKPADEMVWVSAKVWPDNCIWWCHQQYSWESQYQKNHRARVPVEVEIFRPYLDTH